MNYRFTRWNGRITSIHYGPRWYCTQHDRVRWLLLRDRIRDAAGAVLFTLGLGAAYAVVLVFAY